MGRVVGAIIFLLTAAVPIWADEPVIWACECSGGNCPGFKVRFDGQDHAQIAPLDVPHGWSPWRDAKLTKKSLEFSTYYDHPDMGCLTINRETGEFRSYSEEINSFEALAWTHAGVCRRISFDDLGKLGKTTTK